MKAPCQYMHPVHVSRACNQCNLHICSRLSDERSSACSSNACIVKVCVAFLLPCVCVLSLCKGWCKLCIQAGTIQSRTTALPMSITILERPLSIALLSPGGTGSGSQEHALKVAAHHWCCRASGNSSCGCSGWPACCGAEDRVHDRAERAPDLGVDRVPADCRLSGICKTDSLSAGRERLLFAAVCLHCTCFPTCLLHQCE